MRYAISCAEENPIFKSDLKKMFEKWRNFIVFTRKARTLLRTKTSESLISTCVCYNDAHEVIAFELSRQRQ